MKPSDRGTTRAAEDGGELGRREPLPRGEEENLAVALSQLVEGPPQRTVTLVRGKLRGNRSRQSGAERSGPPRSPALVGEHASRTRQQPGSRRIGEVFEATARDREHLTDGIIRVGSTGSAAGIRVHGPGMHAEQSFQALTPIRLFHALSYVRQPATDYTARCAPKDPLARASLAEFEPSHSSVHRARVCLPAQVRPDERLDCAYPSADPAKREIGAGPSEERRPERYQR